MLIEGKVTESAQERMPARRRLLLWIVESDAGRTLVGVPLVILCMAPVFWLGPWWIVLIIVAGLAFSLGWNMARRAMQRDGWIDKL